MELAGARAAGPRYARICPTVLWEGMMDSGTRPQVFVTRRIDQAALDLLEGHALVTVWEDFHPPPREVLLAKAGECAGPANDADGPGRRGAAGAFARAVGGEQHGNGAGQRGRCGMHVSRVLVGSTPGVLAKTCAEMTIGLLLAAARRVVEGDGYARDGSWKVWHPQAMLGRDLHGATLALWGWEALAWRWRNAQGPSRWRCCTTSGAAGPKPRQRTVCASHLISRRCCAAPTS